MSAPAFFDAVDDPGAFQCGRFNLFKVFQVRHLFATRLGMGSNPAWLASSRSGNPGLLGRIRRLAAAAGSLARLSRHRGAGRPVLFYGVSGRISEFDGAAWDLYNARVIAESPERRFIVVEDSEDDRPKTYPVDLALGAFAPLYAAARALLRLAWRPRLTAYAAALCERYPALNLRPAETAWVAAAFYAQFYVLRAVIGALRPECAIVLCHYGREPFIAACKDLGIPVVELQHGAITPASNFYFYPTRYAPYFGSAIFPESLGVYGPFWRDLVIRGGMYPAASVFVAGYYLKLPPPHTANRDPQGCRLILITGQPTVQAEMVAYLAFLGSRLDRGAWRVIFKPHPRESTAAYQPVLQPGFIELSQENTYLLLARAAIHISAYSTVLYEAIRSGCRNYALYVPSAAEHWQEIVDSGVALPLMPDELPNLDSSEPAAEPDAARFLSPYDQQALFETRP